MNLKAITSNINTLLYDGEETDYYKQSFSYNIDSHHTIHFTHKELVYLDELPAIIGRDNFQHFIEKFPKAIPSKYFPDSYSGADGLPLMFIQKRNLNREYLIILSSGEFQPSRFKLYLEGIWEIVD